MLSPHAADDTFERLYQNAEEQRIARDVRESVGNNECTFQPEINERSRELARHSDDRSLHEYLYKEGLAKTLQRQSLGDYKTTLRHRMEDEEMEHCTFDPVIWKGKKKKSSKNNVIHDDESPSPSPSPSPTNVSPTNASPESDTKRYDDLLLITQQINDNLEHEQEEEEQEEEEQEDENLIDAEIKLLEKEEEELMDEEDLMDEEVLPPTTTAATAEENQFEDDDETF